MRTLAEDTSPEMEAVLINLWRKRTPAQKVGSVVSLRQMSKQLILSDLRSRYPRATERELYHQLNMRRLGEALADKIFPFLRITCDAEAKMLNEMQILVAVAERLEKLNIPY